MYQHPVFPCGCGFHELLEMKHYRKIRQPSVTRVVHRNRSSCSNLYMRINRLDYFRQQSLIVRAFY